MHMWMWYGYDLGEFLFAGLTINTRWAFAVTWIVLFFVAVLFEGSKVYLAQVQKEAHKKLNPYRCDERRTLLCERDPGNTMEPTTSRNASSGQVSRWGSFRVRTLVNTHQTTVFVVHNVVGYLLMLVVMLYNVHLLLAVVFGMMLGYFLFGTKLTRLQMQCFSTKRMVICTPECDDTDRCNTEKCSWEVCEGKLCKQLDALELQQADTTLAQDSYRPKYILPDSHILYFLFGLPAEHTTPPLLDTPASSESDLFICQTRTCIQPSHYFPATQDNGESSNASCYYGAKKCPSKVARAKKIQSTSHCHHGSEKEDSPSVEDAQLLRSEHGCCKKQEAKEEKCCKSSQSTTVVIHEKDSLDDDSEKKLDLQNREDSPQITCCHAKATSSESQEQIIK